MEGFGTGTDQQSTISRCLWLIVLVGSPMFCTSASPKVVYHQCLTTPVLVKLSYSIIYYCWSYNVIYNYYIQYIYIISHYKTFISPWYPDSATKMTIICGSKSIYHAMKCCSYSHDIPITFPSYINHHQAIGYIYTHNYIYIYIIVYIYR